MTREELVAFWKEEERAAHIHGWDFSHIADRSVEQTDFPWDYRQAVECYLSSEKKLLDVDTGGGEFLLSLGHPYKNTAAAEGYAPNVELCKKICFRLELIFGKAPLPKGCLLPKSVLISFSIAMGI